MKSLTLLLAFLFLTIGQSFAQITTYPYTEDFEVGAGGWTTTGTLWALGTPAGVTINSAGSGVNSWMTGLATNYPNSANETVTSPTFDFSAVPNPSIQVSIWYDSEFSWDGTVLQSSIDGGVSWQNVGALNDPVNWYNDATISGNPGGQQVGWSSPNSGGWSLASHDLNGLGGLSSVILRFAFGSDGSVNGYDGFAFDDVTILNVTCPQPTALTATPLATTADIGWTENGTATIWNIEYGPTGFIPTGTPTITGTTNNPETISGLSPITSYSFYVQSDCGGGDLSLWTGPFTFVTGCATVVAPWTDDIEAHPASTAVVTSNCWNGTGTGVYDWNVTTSGTTPSSNTGALTANSGSNYFYTEASGATVGATATITSPSVDVSALTLPMVEFYYHMTGAQMGDLMIEAWDGSTWNFIDEILGEQQAAQADAFNRKAVYLPGYNGVIQVRLTATSGGSFEGDICIDDFSILEAPTCPEPMNFMLTGADLTSADLDWTPVGTETEWQLEYGAPGFIPETGAGTTLLTSTVPSTITGLPSNGFYEVYLQAVCSPGDTSFLVGPILFNTYNQGLYMESDSDCGSGFNNISNLTPNAIGNEQSGLLALPFPFLFQGVLMTDVTVDDNGALQFGTTNNVGATNQSMSVAPDGLFPFWDDLDLGDVYIGISGTAPNQTLIFQWQDRPHWAAVAGQEVTFQLQMIQSTGEIYFYYTDKVFGGSQAAFDYGGSATIGVAGPNQDVEVSFNDQQYLMDNSCVHFYYTDCPKPQNYTVVYTTNNEGAISWNAGYAGETEWTVIYGPEGFNPVTGGTTVNTSTPALIMPGLDDITTYDVYIYADCNPGVLQSNGYLGQFTTLPNCSDVTGITTSTAVDSVFTGWSWTESSGIGTYPSTGFNLQYGAPGFGLFGGTETIVNADNNFTDTTVDNTLLGGGVYEVYVQSVCGTDTSNWVGPVTFTMPITNDAVCNAIDLSFGTLYTFNNTGATAQTGEGAIAPPTTGWTTITGWGESNMSNTTWFTFTAPASGNMSVSGVTGGLDGQIAIYEATDCSNFSTFSLIGANDDAVSGGSPSPDFTACGMTPGNTYYLVHDGTFGASGVYTIYLDNVSADAGTSTGIIDVCVGQSVNLFTGLSGYDTGGSWSEEIPTLAFADPIFNSTGLGPQIFNFEYEVFNGCANDTVIQQVQVFGPSSAGIDGTVTICMNEPINLLSGLGGNIDMGGTWYDPANNALPSGNITGSWIPGQFNYDYIVSNGACPNDTSNVVINVLPSCDYLNIQENYFNSIEIHPNPTTGVIYISNFGSNEILNYEVTDLKGRVVAKKANAINGTETSELDLGAAEPGIYLIKLYGDDAEKTYRIVKQ